MQENFQANDSPRLASSQILFFFSAPFRLWRGVTTTEDCLWQQGPEFTPPGCLGEAFHEPGAPLQLSFLSTSLFWLISKSHACRRVGSLQLLSRLAVRAALSRESSVQQLPLPPRLRALVAALFASTIRYVSTFVASFSLDCIFLTFCNYQQVLRAWTQRTQAFCVQATSWWWSTPLHYAPPRGRTSSLLHFILRVPWRSRTAFKGQKN